MKFGERFFHQIKGTSVGSPMSVNFATLLMGQFETNMLNDYNSKYNKLPGIWLRYTDDIFFTWNYDKTSLEHFINFCKTYSSNHSMKSHITFTSDYSTDYVYFVDTKVKFKEQKPMSEIYSKPTASCQYLHRTSYRPPHTFRSILRSQFIRIRRICSDINDYWSLSKRFTNFFKSRGFNHMIIDKISAEISKIPRQDLYNNNNPNIPINQLLQTERTSRIPFVTTWHRKLSGFQSTLHHCYQKMINDYPELKCVFPAPPILAYRRNRNLGNLLVHTSKPLMA